VTATYLTGFPELFAAGSQPELRTRGSTAFLRTAGCVARLALDPARVEWRAERHLAHFPESSRGLPRPIRLGLGGALWASADSSVVAELLPAELGAVTLSVRDGETGRELWRRTIEPPDAAEWAETVPAWPGAQTEDVYAFLADDTDHLVVCLLRESRRSGIIGQGYVALTLPPYNCQTDATRFDLMTGAPVWRATFPNVQVRITERPSFAGLWAYTGRVGRIDWKSGTNTILHQSPHRLGWPVRVSNAIAVSWHSASRVGVDWLDEAGAVCRSASWPLRGVKRTALHPGSAGLAVQTNDQRLWLLGDDDAPLWDVRVKQPVYRAFQSGSSPLLVGTDGNGGRLLGFDLASGQETLNLRPAIGGAGGLAKVPGHDVLVCPFTTSRSHHVPARLLVLNVRDNRHELTVDCWGLLGTWEHGAVCGAGLYDDRIVTFDVRSFMR
jgi:hypothetical protein